MGNSSLQDYYNAVQQMRIQCGAGNSLGGLLGLNNYQQRQGVLHSQSNQNEATHENKLLLLTEIE